MNKNDINKQQNKEIHIRPSNKTDEELFDIFETNNKQKLTHYVVQQVIKNKVPMLTFGKQWEIYVVTLPYQWSEKYFLVAKKKRNTSESERFDLRDEFRMQALVYENVQHPWVRVPELFGYQEFMKGEQFIVMEFVPGQTLYTLLLNKVVEKNRPEWNSAKNDREVDTNIVKIFGIEKAKNILSRVESHPYIYAQTAGMKLFTPEQSKIIQKNIKEFLNKMHHAGIYHRDLWGSLRNIMFCPNGEIYIIDFGKAIKKEQVKNKKSIYQERTKEEIKQYVEDEEILKIIQAYTQ